MPILKVNKIYHGDGVKVLANTKLFPDSSIDLIMTSPPYADRRKKQYGGPPPDKYVEWFTPFAAEFQRVLKPRGSLILNVKENAERGERHTYVLELILEMKRNGWLWIEDYIWHKKNVFPGKWRVDVKTPSGALIGRTVFTVRESVSPPALETQLR